MPQQPRPYDPDQLARKREQIESNPSYTESEISAALLEFNERSELESYERSKYAEFKRMRDNGHGQHRSSPKFREWIAECEADWKDATKPIPPGFDEWMKLDKNLPRIRGDNPPNAHLEHARHSEDWVRTNMSYFYAASAAYMFLILLSAFTLQPFIPILLGLASIPIGLYGYSWSRTQEKLANDKLIPLPHHVFNREFTAPLADNSVVRTNIFFTLPLSHIHKDEQLATFTEKEFLIFVATKMTPPTGEEVEDHLAKKLLRFQDENQIPMLRVEVSLHIHIPSPKPKGGGTVSI